MTDVLTVGWSMTPFQSEVTDKRFALLISTMINTRLTWYKHYYVWADELIAVLPDPPHWLLEIATIKYYPEAVEAINRFVFVIPVRFLGVGLRRLQWKERSDGRSKTRTYYGTES